MQARVHPGVAYSQNGPYRAVQLYAHPSPAADRAEVLRLFAEYRSMMTQAGPVASQGNV